MQFSTPSESEILDLLSSSKEEITNDSSERQEPSNYIANESYKTEELNSSISDSDNKVEPLLRNYRRLEVFDHPAEFQAFFDDNINSGKVTHYPWQVRVSKKIGLSKPTSKHPFKMALCTCNGSGKDKFVIAPTVLWFITSKIRSLVVITSAGGVQLTNQTENDIRILAEKVNTWSCTIADYDFKPILKINQRKIICTLTGSMLVLFATDEPAKAEGYHPLEPDAEMMIVINEAKSVQPDIFNALRRCTGFNYWLLVSSPGQPAGPFYDAFETWEHKELITYYDCPHHSVDEFEYDRKQLGEHDWLFRSKWLGLFTFIGGKTIVNEAAVRRLRSRIKLNQIPQIKSDRATRIGIDIALSSRGDETVITAFKGNKQTFLKSTRNQDSVELANWISHELTELGILKDHPYIYIDDGGVGRAIIPMLRQLGWLGIVPILNQSPAKNKVRYRNRGAELAYKLSRLIEAGAIILIDDDKLYSQILSRKFKESTAGVDKLTLEAKHEMKDKGMDSPDRFDATIVALSDAPVDDWINELELRVHPAEQPKISQEEMWANLNREVKRGEQKIVKSDHSFYSISVCLERDPQYTFVE